ncbi:hypothetical protein [Embleya sp. NBC_00888]|uniref:hypothetical protein n=1 Tax=Embleya sp. NBC_00888 TaxID=2975960 RepID=UPI002F91218A
MTTLPAGVEVLVGCQTQGEEIIIASYTNQWWAYLPQYGGYITNKTPRGPPLGAEIGKNRWISLVSGA